MKLLLLSGLALALAPATANAAITLTFEGLGDLEEIGSFYDGGPGGNLGIVFSTGSQALIDEDYGGSGNTAFEPSGETTLFFSGVSSAILNYSAGFGTGFSFFYSAASPVSVSVYDGLNGTGSLLGTINLTAQFNVGCVTGTPGITGDPLGDYCNWTPVGVGFAGVAKSIVFGGGVGNVVFDNVTFGDIRPGGAAVPEPATWAMMLAGFGLVGAGTRRRRQSVRVTYA